MLVRFLLLAGLASCGAVDRCQGVPCSEGRVCVVKSSTRVACEVPDAGAP